MYINSNAPRSRRASPVQGVIGTKDETPWRVCLASHGLQVSESARFCIPWKIGTKSAAVIDG